MSIEQPAVSVCTTTYNAVKYIEETILGVMSQVVTFRFEYVIVDDCSSDGTQTILGEYAKKYPEIIRVICQPANIGLNKNFMAAMNLCRGKYIALLDGDDYWTDTGKLQMQYDFLENHPELVLCSTASLKKHESSGTYTRSHQYLPANTGDVMIFGTPEMYKLDPFWLPTHSVMLRACHVDFPDWFKDVIYVDRALRLILSLHGDLAFINKITCVYRLHGSNTSADREISPDVCKGYLHTYWNFYQYSGKKFKADACKAINHSLCEERRRIRESYQGTEAIRRLSDNFISALRHFRIAGIRDVAKFGYHFLFVKDAIDWVKYQVDKYRGVRANV